MPFSGVPLTKEVFARIGWTEVLDEVDKRECRRYSRLFFAKAEEAEGDEEAREALLVLGAITSMNLNPGSREEPLEPMAVFSTHRSAALEDLSDDHVAALREIAPEVADPELCARIADTVWCIERDHQMAELAAEAYLRSTNNLRSDRDWLRDLERTERAMALVAELGRPAELLSKAVECVEAAIREYEDVRFDRPRARFMQLLQRYRAGDAEEYAILAEKAAISAENARNWAEARQFWKLRARWREMSGDSGGRRNALVRAAETHVGEAEEELAGEHPSYIAACAHLEKAIEGLRRAGKTQKRVEELHAKLLEYEVRTRDEMAAHHQSVDLSDLAERSRLQVKGRPIGEALLALAFCCVWPSENLLRERAEEASREVIWALVQRDVVDEKGKVIARKPSFFSNDPEEVERAIRAEMLSLANDHREMYAAALIYPAWRQIDHEHTVQLRDLLPIVQDNPFVPEGREHIYAQGLLFGFRGDFSTAAHLLVPQLESSIRHILARSGVIVSKYDAFGVQEEKDLGALLRLPELEQLLEQDLLFDLQGLLVERFGANLRNKIAHGLMSRDELSSASVVYLWWLVLRMCLAYVVVRRRGTPPGQDEKTSS